MDSDSNKNDCPSINVKDLQATLFPLSTLQLPRLLSSPGSFLGSFLLKSNQLEVEEGYGRPGTASSYTVPRLREPRDLFALGKEGTCSTQPPRWPTECQVLDEKVEHISYNPSTPEPYYVPNGKEVQPKPMGDEYGTTVFQYYPVSAINYFNRSCVGGSRYLQTGPNELEEDDLRFESRFESGNLAKAVKLTATFYELYLRTDLYTNRHTQWFYFRITNAKRHILYRFSIVNLSKGDSLYNSGMKPLMYSTKDAKLHNIGWRRCGDNIVYFCNDNGNPDEDQPATYTLTFTMEFPHDKDIVYLAHSYPYTYSDLQDYLTQLTGHPVKSSFTSLRLLCRSLAGNNVYYVTVTSPNTPSDKKKKAIVITARVHPGEAPSSWMMKGILDFLTGDSAPARELREKFIFKIVPMINPDGVIVGNSRCSLTGRDLNRQYRTVIRESYPGIWHIKLMVRRLLEECGVAMYCDLHAHSRQNNIFIYGCENRRCLDRYLHEQVFPLMLHKNAADKFSFENCKFRVQRCKEGAGRVVMWMMGIANSYTMEASFAGSDVGPRADTHFSTLDYEQMGRAFCQTLVDFYDDAPTKEKLRCKIIKKLLKEGSTADEPTNITLSDYSSDEGDSSSSEEGGGRETYVVPIVPPPTPLPIKTRKKKAPPLQKQVVTNKSPTLPRKTLPLCQATVGLSLADDSYSSSDSLSDYNSSPSRLERPKTKPRRNTRRKVAKHTKIYEHSDTEIQVKKHSKRSLTVLEILPAEKLRSQSWNRYAGFPQSRKISQGEPNKGSKEYTAHQLAEVQAKLLSLRHRIWTGINDGDNEPLAWGFSSLSQTQLQKDSKDVTSKDRKKLDKRKSKTETDKQKSKGGNNKLDKKKRSKEENKNNSSPKKKQNGIRRQTAIDCTNIYDDYPPILLTRSTSNIYCRKSIEVEHCVIAESGDEKKTANSLNTTLTHNNHKKKLKSKKPKAKWEKKSKNLCNVKVFIDRCEKNEK